MAARHLQSSTSSIGSLVAIMKIWALLLLSAPSFNNNNAVVVTAQSVVYELETTYEGGWVQDGVMFDVVTVETPTSEIAAQTTTTIPTTTPNGITVHGLNILTPLTEPLCVELYTKEGSFSSAASNKAAWEFLGSFTLQGQGPSNPTNIPIGSFDPINIGIGSTQAFYVTTQNEKLRYTALDQDLNEGVTGDIFVSSEAYYNYDVAVSERNVDVGSNSVGVGKERTSAVVGSSAGERGERHGEPHHHHHHHHNHDHARKLDETDDAAKDEHDNRILQSSDGLSVNILTGVAKNYPFAESWPHRVFNGALLYTIGTNTKAPQTVDSAQDAFVTKRGMVTCDSPAQPLSSLSTAPTGERVPSASPIKAPSQTPTKLPTKLPTLSPTTFESTINKVATTLHGGLKQAGMMFDVRVPTVAQGGPSEGLTILGFETSTFLKDSVCIEVYTKGGTYEGFENDVVQNADGTWSSPSWSILGAATVTGAGETQPTVIPIGSLDPIFIEPGQTQAFYVTMTITEQRYTEPKFGEKSGDVFSSSEDKHLDLLVGAAVEYPFGEFWADRIYNGAVVYALGNVPDGKYSDMTAADRDRSCPKPTPSPTKSPITTAAGEITTTKSPTSPPGAPTEKPVTISPSWEGTSVPEEVDQDATDSASSRLADLCPSAVVITPEDMVTMNVLTPYEYTFISDSTADTTLIVTEMENTLHRSLMESFCPVGTGDSARRTLKDVIDYQGFRSNPADVINTVGCDASVVVPDGQTCYLVSGGVVAVVPSDTDSGVVMSDVGNFANKVMSNPSNYEAFGITEVAFTPLTSDSTDENPFAGDNDGSDKDVVNVDGAQQSNEAADSDGSGTGLSQTGVIIVAVLCSVLAIILVALLAMHMRKKRKEADGSELFEEFPDEEERYGSAAGYNDSIAPLSNWGRKSKPPPPPPSSAPPALNSPAVILNEQDDISLFSSEKSRSRFAPSSMVAVAPDSPGSKGSRGSNSSKKSVEFVRAGQSFSTTRSNQPEDTVDL